MQPRTHVIGNKRTPLFRAPDDMNQNVGGRLGHFVSPFQGLFNICDSQPRALPWAIMFCAFGAANGAAMCLSVFIRG
jgi:hypothetical protein